MATGIELGLLVLVALVLAAVYLTMKVIKPLVYNAIVGLVLLALINFLKPALPFLPEVEISILAVAVIALAGVPGVVLVVLLAFLGVAFEPAFLLPPLGVL